MDRIKVIVPSRGRAKNVTTQRVVDDVILVVPFNEYDLYKEHNPNVEIIQRPKDVMGISRVRQYILDQFEEPFMLDDDVDYFMRFYADAGEPYKEQNPKAVREIMNQLKYMAEDIGAKMYGFTKNVRPCHYESWRPFKLNAFMCASQCGYLKGHDLKENFDIVSADDYYMSCLNMYKNRYMLRDERYGFVSSNFENKGGLQNVRNTENMKSDTLILREHFGSVVEMKTLTKHLTSMNEGERRLTFPF